MRDVIRLDVVLTPSDTVQRYRAQVADLRAQVKALREQVRHLEWEYGMESHLNNELLDLLRDNGVEVREVLRSRRRGR